MVKDLSKTLCPTSGAEQEGSVLLTVYSTELEMQMLL